jgi:hypothetical protein
MSSTCLILPEPSFGLRRLPRIAAAAVLGLAFLLAERPAGLQAAPAGIQEGGGSAVAEEVAFLRLSRDEAGRPLSLDTSLVEYVNDDRGNDLGDRHGPLQVDLVSAVHVGSGDYYETLNRLFAEYDSVLYELVAPPNARVPKPGRRPSGMIGSAQQGLTQLLGLEFQLERIDYTAENFVHADLSPKEFSAAMAKRGESWWTMFTRLLREGAARAERGDAPSAPDIGVSEMFGLLFGSGPGRQVKLRRIMAEQFADMDALTAAFGGEKGSTLITDRNAAALDVLRERIDAGDRRIAIFYGAAHMEDFDRRLRADFDLQPRETAWLEAWDLREPAGATGRR